jgi:hypothetical protein
MLLVTRMHASREQVCDPIAAAYSFSAVGTVT